MGETTTLAQAALEYLARGWSVFPLQGKRPLFSWKELQRERPTREQVERWWEEHPNAGIGVALGRVSNLIRVDGDSAQGIQKMLELSGELETTEFSTPTGGYGWLFSYTEGVVTEAVWVGEGEHNELRVQSDGAYTVLPPSPHPKGGYYAWIKRGRLSAVPTWIRDKAVERVLKDLVKELRPTLRQPDKEEALEALKHIPADEYDVWIQVGMALHTSNMLKEWIEWSKTSDKYQEGACERKWNTFGKDTGGLSLRSLFYWAERYGWKPQFRHEPLTELGNARVLARMGEGRIKHSAKWGWMAWDGRRWVIEGAEKHVIELQKAVLKHRIDKAVESLAKHMKTDREADNFVSKQKNKAKTIAAIRAHEAETRIRGARILAESEPSLNVDYREFDTKKYLLNCANGTLDLARGVLQDFNPEDKLTPLCPTSYVDGKTSKLWMSFLEQILPDIEVRNFLQQFFGCCLTGDVSPQIMPVFWGTGSNGKSTLINAIMYVLGDEYAMKAKRELLMAKRNSDHPTSVARLFGKRFVACIETGSDGRIDETLVKELTGGDKIAARRMREDEWEFDPSHKPVLITNHKPDVRDTDDGIWRRLPLVPFTVQFTDANKDPELVDKLKDEATGILSWMVEGCYIWLNNKRQLVKPRVVSEATESYRAEHDRTALFLADKCVIGPDKKVRMEKLVEAYASWCAINRQPQMNGNAFGRALSEKGFHLEGKGSKYRVGLDVV